MEITAPLFYKCVADRQQKEKKVTQVKLCLRTLIMLKQINMIDKINILFPFAYQERTQREGGYKSDNIILQARRKSLQQPRQ